MICYPDIQEKVAQEILSATGGNRLPTMEDKPNTPLTEACIHELLRFRTVAPINPPSASKVTESKKFICQMALYFQYLFRNLFRSHIMADNTTLSLELQSSSTCTKFITTLPISPSLRCSNLRDFSIKKGRNLRNWKILFPSVLVRQMKLNQNHSFSKNIYPKL